MGLLTFKGGIHPDDGKRFSKDSEIRTLLPKGELAYPLSQHIGAPANPIVKKGDHVLKGQKIAEAGGFVSSPIHASVSGTVKGIEWGLSTRIIGAIIMVHGDDSGLVLPPRIAPVQTRVIPIAQHKEGVLDKANELLDALNKAGYRAKIDDSEKSPGWKFSEQEMLGIPTRIEIGPKDIENGGTVVLGAVCWNGGFSQY